LRQRRRIRCSSLVSFLRLFSVLPQCQGRSFSYDSTFLTTFFLSSSSSTTSNGRWVQLKVLRFYLKELRNTQKRLVFPHTQLLLWTAKHPKTFGFPSHNFSSSSPSTPPNGRWAQQRFLLFPCNQARSTQRFLLWFSNTRREPPSYVLQRFNNQTIMPLSCHLPFMPPSATS